MNKKKALIIAGIVVAVIVILITVIPALIDVNGRRAEIEGQLQAALGRPVQVGNLSLSIWRGAVSAENVSIGEDPAFGKQPFVTAKRLDVGLEMLPLIFSKKINITSLTIEEPQVTLLRSPGGKWNFSSLGAKQTPGKEPAKSEGAGSELSIGRLRVVNGTVLVGQTNRKPHSYTEVNVEASGLSYTSSFPFTVEANGAGGGKLNIDGTAGPLNREDVAMTPLDAKVKLQHVDLAATGVLPPSAAVAGTIDHDGTIKSDGKTANVSGQVKATGLKLVKGGQPARIPVTLDYASAFDLKRETGTLTKGDLHAGKSTIRLTGNYDTKGESTVVHMKMAAQGVPMEDVEGLLPAVGVILPSGARMRGGSVSANLALDGPLDRLVTSGPVSINNTTLVGFKMPSAAKAMAGIDTGSGVVIRSFTAGVRAAPDVTQLSNINTDIQNVGTATANGTIAQNGALNFRGVAQLSQANLAGALSQIFSMGQKRGQLPFQITGTTANPIFVPDIGGIVGGAATSPAQGVGGLVQGLFGKKKK